jgi:CRISPR-associated protein Cas2
MSSQFVVVVYDISDDKRRTKLHNVLLNFGTPVQYSVFECLLDGERLAEMKRSVERVIRPRKDRVRFYYICQQCLSKTEVTSGEEVLHETDVIVV